MKDIALDYTNVMQDAVGETTGLAETHLDALAKRAAEIHTDLVAKRAAGMLPFYDLPYITEEAKALIRSAKGLAGKCANFVTLGIGGSALGTTAIFSALAHPQHNSLSANKRPGARLFVADNIDPDSFAALISTLNLKETVFNVVSKSGSTAETLAQFLIIYDLLRKKLGRDWKKHLVVTTDARKGILREIADTHGLKSFLVPDGVGGRFTAFTPVCLLPAAVAGVDIIGLLKGAARMDERCRSGSIRENPAYLFAAIHHLLDTMRGAKMTVMMPYSSRLYYVADWFRQLWAESLGKKQDVDGNPVHVGQTPIKSLGATDQHSQVQLYVEGPFDKLAVFLKVERFTERMEIPTVFEDKPDARYLCGASLAELINTELEGTIYALTANRRPNMTITLPEITPDAVGQLLYMLEVATAFAGGLYRINAFDQPGV
ncbi:MAG: glucose-6-phosphate isomerase, partial [Nitrospinae bacterium]|nr:glucose-6-phosphate isomerase [Nitrospinota bacterium]